MTKLLNTTDKRIVALAVTFFVVAFLLVNYGELRQAAGRACVEAGEGAPVGYWLDGGALIPGDGASVSVATARLCPVNGPDGTDRVLSLATAVPGLLFSFVALLLLCWFLWGAARPGLHSPVTPGRLRIFGWFVLVAGPVSEAVQYYFTYELAERLLHKVSVGIDEDFNARYSAWLQELQMHFPWWCVFAGVASLIVAKLLRIEVRMGEELEGTI